MDPTSEAFKSVGITPTFDDYAELEGSYETVPLDIPDPTEDDDDEDDGPVVRKRST